MACEAGRHRCVRWGRRRARSATATVADTGPGKTPGWPLSRYEEEDSTVRGTKHQYGREICDVGIGILRCFANVARLVFEIFFLLQCLT